ncbi:MAG: GTP 3',8-cyclase MoaA [Verrucomicrobia bacterium]|nr:GTP 3',8-cyclase MoaA [Verrucomicrobiota bacterium]
MLDPFGRTIDYLRISVTDRCNERCLYCMPEGYKGWAQRPDHLTAAELVRIAAAASQLGFRKFRLTGGEPLLRSDLVSIAAGIAALPTTTALGLSTNGTRLAPVARELCAAGITAINLSLDALNADVYHRVTGGRLADALAGLEAALAADFEVVKLNVVLMRGVNEDQLVPLVRFAAAHRLPVRFIELMPLTRTDVLSPANFLSCADARARIEAELGPLETLPDYRAGHGPARYARAANGATIGFIGALTTTDFCATCNKLRLTADGKLRPCLGRHGEIDLLAPMRGGEADLTALLTEAIANKPADHTFQADYQPDRPMTAIGG